MKKSYDYIFAGYGLAGHLLLYLMSTAGLLKEKQVLVIDREGAVPYTRDWSFWINTSHPFEHLLTNTWKGVSVYFPRFSAQYKLVNYQFQLLRSKDLFSFINDELKKTADVNFCDGDILDIFEREGLGYVQTGKELFSGKIVFDSVVQEKKADLYMSGYGWEIEVEKIDTFNLDEMVLFDYRNSSNNLLEFFYVLPVGEKKAFIDYAHFSTSGLPMNKKVVEEKLRLYIKNCWQTSLCRVKNLGFSSIPLHETTVSKKQSDCLIPIGLASGLMKGTTSFAFSRILADCSLIVSGLENNRLSKPKKKKDFISTLSDLGLIRLMKAKPEIVKSMFENMFRETKTLDTLFRFLDEQESFLEALPILLAAGKGMVKS